MDILCMSAGTSYGKIAVIICFITCLSDFVVTTMLGLVYKDYNSLTDSQSYLGTYDSPVAMYMNTWEFVLGSLLLGCAWCLYQTGFFKTALHKTVLWLLVIYAIGEGIGSGLFPFNHIHHELTATGWAHSIFSGIGITAMVILSFVLVKLFPSKGLPHLHLIFAGCSITGFIFISLCLLSRKNFIDFVGLWQRLYLLAYYVMLFVLTLHVSRMTGRPLGHH